MPRGSRKPDMSTRKPLILQIAKPTQMRIAWFGAGVSSAVATKLVIDELSGIARPTMYEPGYHNNNCVGCVKGGMGYWNKIQHDFPQVFARRAMLEHQVGASCIGGVFWDELDPERGRHEPPVVDDCGIMCELRRLS